MDLVVRQAALPETEGLWDVAIENGYVRQIVPQYGGAAREELIASGNLLSPGFVDAHVHLDKNLIGEDLPFFPADSLEERIQVARKVQWEMAKQPVGQRALNMVRLAVSQGTTTMRTHADIDPIVGLKNLEALLQTREQCRNLMDIQVVAFPQSGILRAPGTEKLLREALEMGADAVGGIDPGGFDGDTQQHIDIVFSLAEAFGVDVDIHLHDPGHLGTFTLERIAKKTTDIGYEGRVLIGHAFCLGEVSRDALDVTLQRLAEAQISIVSAPQSSRSLPPVQRLLEANVNILCASDNVRDAWSPFGNANMLEQALLVAYRFNLRTDEEIMVAYRMATSYPAKALRMASAYGVAEGKVADFVLLKAPLPKQAVISQAPRLAVIKNGCVVFKDGQLVGAPAG